MKQINYNVLDPRHSSIRGLLNDLHQGTMAGSVKNFTPSVDVYENDQHYGIILALPGMSKGDIKIDIQENKLFVSGERKLQAKEATSYHIQEIPYGVFSKVFYLSKRIDQDKIEAQYEEGLLQLLLPKNQKLKHKYQIKIK